MNYKKHSIPYGIKVATTPNENVAIMGFVGSDMSIVKFDAYSSVETTLILEDIYGNDSEIVIPKDVYMCIDGIIPLQKIVANAVEEGTAIVNMYIVTDEI